jgi:hypothetical protein
MTAQLFNVTYLKTANPYQVGETAAWPLDQAVRLIVAGIARIGDAEPEREALEAAVRAHKQAPSVRWELYLCQPRYFQGRDN